MDVGLRLKREEILSAIIKPNLNIAEGYGSVNVFTIDDKLFTGRIASETADAITMIIDDGQKTTQEIIPRDRIDSTKKALSAMPTDIAEKLTRREIRDLVEFLSQRKKQ
jgi:putative heme-binding domain-containing protein